MAAGTPLRRVVFPNDPSAPAPSERLIGVIVTVHDASSYDPLFREYKQESVDGRVSVWECGTAELAPILDRLQERSSPDASGAVRDLASELDAVGADNAVFNWECCGACSDAGFADTPLVARAIEVLLSRGHTLMFSDFSLKALIGAWSRGEALRSLGRCPLVRLGDFSSTFELGFDPVALQQCGSAQLERVGALCESGEATVAALGGTIAYTVDHAAVDASRYGLEVLTVVTKYEGQPALSRYAEALGGSRVCAAGQRSGAAGHVRLTLPNGGALLLSCGHWVELVRLDVTAERMLQVAEQTYGQERRRAMEVAVAAAAPAAREQLVQEYARNIVVQSSPGRTKKG